MKVSDSVVQDLEGLLHSVVSKAEDNSVDPIKMALVDKVLTPLLMKGTDTNVTFAIVDRVYDWVMKKQDNE